MRAQIACVLCPWLVAPLASLATAADAGRLGHGWLLSGPRGVGKLNLAYVLADRLLAGAPGSSLPLAGPRSIVSAYNELAEPIDLHADLHRVRQEDDRHTIAIDQVRELISSLALTPHVAQAKVVVMEDAETMTPDAANAILKSLEEPTRNTYLLLLAERPGRLPATVRSRCQHLRIQGPPLAAARQWLAADGIESEGLSPALLQRSPIAAARIAIDSDNLSNYKELQTTLGLLLEGEIDPHVLAGSWAGGDVDLALSCLIERLRLAIRAALVPGHSNFVTDPSRGLSENSATRSDVDSLFAVLQMAENLRDQLGRGLNVELALKSILVGLVRGDARRLYS